MRLLALAAATFVFLIPTVSNATLVVDGIVSAMEAATDYTIQRPVTLTDNGMTLTDNMLFLHHDTNNSLLHVAYQLSNTFTSNNYDPAQTGCHTFFTLLQSDRVGFTLRDSSGTTVMTDTELVIDYIAGFNPSAGPDDDVPDFYRSSGLVEGKSKVGPGGLDSAGTAILTTKGTTVSKQNIGHANGSGIADGNNIVPQAESSLGWNLSPNVDPTATMTSNNAHPSWEDNAIYEFVVNLGHSSLSGSNFDFTQINSIVPTFTHTSPACWESGTPTVTVIPEPSAFLLGFVVLAGSVIARRFGSRKRRA